MPELPRLLHFVYWVYWTSSSLLLTSGYGQFEGFQSAHFPGSGSAGGIVESLTNVAHPFSSVFTLCACQRRSWQTHNICFLGPSERAVGRTPVSQPVNTVWICSPIRVCAVDQQYAGGSCRPGLVSISPVNWTVNRYRKNTTGTNI